MSFKDNTARAKGSVGSNDLQALKRGEISMDEYLERRLEIQVNRLSTHLSDNQKEQLRSILLDHFMDDPVLRHYAGQASGKTSQIP